MRTRRDKGEKEESVYNLDPLFQSTILISDQPYHFPAIEWCFDDDRDGIDLAAKNDVDATDHDRLFQFDTRTREMGCSTVSDKQHFSQMRRCTAHPNLGSLFHCAEQQNSTSQFLLVRK